MMEGNHKGYSHDGRESTLDSLTGCEQKNEEEEEEEEEKEEKKCHSYIKTRRV